MAIQCAHSLSLFCVLKQEIGTCMALLQCCEKVMQTIIVEYLAIYQRYNTRFSDAGSVNQD